MSMFCYQCQEAAHNTGCTIQGVCGKTDEVSNLQDLLIYVTKGISILAHIGREHNYINAKADKYVFDSLFITITNANFDATAIMNKIKESYVLREEMMLAMQNLSIALPAHLPDQLVWKGLTAEDMTSKSLTVSILNIENEDIRSLKELLTYGVKGIAAYAEHAFNLNYKSEEIYAFMHKALHATCQLDISVEDLIAMNLECGKFGVDVMALLDQANTESYGHPEMTTVNLGVGTKPGILISGHDLKDIEDLLIQTEGTDVDVYSHCEMLPAHYYPAFKKYEHFVGNYGNAWWAQKGEFESFNGPILFTTNCIVPPKDSYKERVYTTGTSGFEGCTHIADRKEGEMKDFSAIIEHAKKCEAPIEIETGSIVGGFAHNQIGLLADKVVDAVKSGAVKNFVVMAGCDGRQKGREYYTDFAKDLPEDNIILTAGCAKFRYNKLELGDIGGIPRVLDAGQCNDSYSLAVTAMKLQEVFELEDINELPITYNIAWYEQKAVIVLLALLHLGVKDIHLGPTLPAFLSPNVANVLIENFGIAGIGEVKEDLVSMTS